MVYKILWYVTWPFFRLVYRFKVTGAGNIPKKGGVILCSNHIHAVDCIFIPTAIRRKTRFMAKKELFGSRPLAWLITLLGAVSVDRASAADMSVYKNVVKILKNGEAILIFIQGRRMKELRADDAKGGAALFALKTDTPVIPIGLVATYRPFSRIAVNVGRPVDLSEFAGEKLRAEILEKAARKIMGEVVRLAEAAGTDRPNGKGLAGNKVELPNSQNIQ